MLVEVKRSDWLPPYNDEAVRKTISEINILNDEIEKTLTPEYQQQMQTDLALKPFLHVHFNAMLRNKRCTLAYLQYRMNKIEQLRWEIGTIIPPEQKVYRMYLLPGPALFLLR